MCMGPSIHFGLITRHITRIPIVVSIQGNLTVYNKKYFTGLNMPGLLRRLRSGYPFFQSDYQIWQKRAAIEREILRKTQYVFGRTDWDRRICLMLAPGADYFHVDEVIRPRFYGLTRGGMDRGGLTLEGETREEGMDRGKVANPAPIFLTTSSPSFYKGFETVIETARLLTGNGMSFTWLVAGLKEGDALVKLIRGEMGAADLGALQIRLLGILSEEELAGHLSTADVYVQVSHIENSPNSLCEAMLAGMPIVASFAGGTASLLRDGEQGVLVQDGDPYALAGAMEEMVKYPERYAPMAAEARRVALRRHDPEAILTGMLDRYVEIIKRHAAKRHGDQPFGK